MWALQEFNGCALLQLVSPVAGFQAEGSRVLWVCGVLPLPATQHTQNHGNSVPSRNQWMKGPVLQCVFEGSKRMLAQACMNAFILFWGRRPTSTELSQRAFSVTVAHHQSIAHGEFASALCRKAHAISAAEFPGICRFLGGYWVVPRRHAHSETK